MSIAPLRHAGYTIKVDVTPEASRAAPETQDLSALANQLQQTLTQIAPVVVDGLIAQEGGQFERLVDVMLGGQRPTPIDMTRARMAVSALRAVFTGTEWLTAAEITELAGFGQANRSGAANRWKQNGKVFALPHEGQDRYPRYLLDEAFRPLPGAEKVLSELQGFSPSRLANWFESRTGLLGGQRPRELLASKPERVIEAARRTLDAELNAA